MLKFKAGDHVLVGETDMADWQNPVLRWVETEVLIAVDVGPLYADQIEDYPGQLMDLQTLYVRPTHVMDRYGMPGGWVLNLLCKPILLPPPETPLLPSAASDSAC